MTHDPRRELTSPATATVAPYAAPNEEAFSYYEPLARVRQFVLERLDREITLTQASEVADLSPKYFSAFFHQHTGVRFRDWVTELRINRAKRMLEERNRSIASVAGGVGFKDVRTFQRAFKKVTGMTPIAYKKSVAP